MTVTVRNVAPDTHALGTFAPVPGAGVLAMNAYLIKAQQPVLVDTGLLALREEFMTALRSEIDPAEIRWIWITHTDPDHIGNLEAVLAAAPQARVVTTFLGMGKMDLLGLPTDRAFLLNPGQRLDAGDRTLVAIKPPSFDAPETTGLFDSRTRALFSADAFGALLAQPEEDAAAIAGNDLKAGLVTWATVDAPWLHTIDPARFAASLQAVRALDSSVILSSHLPPARGITDALLSNLAAAHEAPVFVGPDQAALEQMMAAVA